MGLFHNDTALDMCIKCGNMYNRQINSKQAHCNYCDPDRPGPWSDWMQSKNIADELDYNYFSFTSMMKGLDPCPAVRELVKIGYEIQRRPVAPIDIERGDADGRVTWMYRFRYMGGRDE